MAPADAPMLTVTVSFSPRAGEVDEAVMRLPLGATAGDAIRASGVRGRHPAIAVEPGVDPPAIGIWGERCTLARGLRDGDRVEIYRPLAVDPKEARRERYRATGAARRPGRGSRRPPTATTVSDQAKPSS